MLLACLVFLHSTVSAQQLSFRRYNVADGLAHDAVTALLQDSFGYLWIGTYEGLSRFDGYTIRSYGTESGIGNYVINGLAEDSSGRLWVATNGGGISVLEHAPSATPRFSSYVPGPGGASNVNVIVADRAGRLWCGTDDGVYVATVTGSEPVFAPAGFDGKAAVAAASSGDRVWMAILGLGVVEFRGADGTVHPAPSPEHATVRDMAAIGDDVALVVSSTALFRVSKGRWEPLPLELRDGQHLVSLLPDGGDGVWLSTTEGLLHYAAGRTRRYWLEPGAGGRVGPIKRDRGGNLWVALGRTGVAQLRPEQIFRYSAGDGFLEQDLGALMHHESAGMFVITRGGVLARVEEGRLSEAGLARSPAGYRGLAAARDGWWGVARSGIFFVPGPVPRFDRVEHLPLNPEPVLPIPSSVPLVHVGADDELWFTSGEPALYRVRHPRSSSPQRDRWPLPVARNSVPGVLGIDKAGGVWLASMTSLARFFEGRLTAIDPPPGMPNIQPRAFLLDRQGNVWIGLRFGGVMMTRDPAAERPQFVRYSVAEGLSSDAVWSMAEDLKGLIYLGTGRGLDQLDPQTGRVRHFTTEHGLAGNVVNQLKVDATGSVWAATAGGLSRLDLAFASAQPAAVPIYISRILAAGLDHPLPLRGASSVTGVHLSATARNLRIEFVSPEFSHSSRLRYQYMLRGIDAEWSAPAVERTIHYSTLAPGKYRFMVRALTTDGRTSEQPAIVDFEVDPPFWASSWFLTTLFAGLLAATISVQRLRDQRRRGMAAIRTQVATDLHDDVGSGLAQIAILTEVGKRKAGPDALPVLNEVADLARSLRDSMSDIVWAVDPSRDAPVALIDRMRQVTFNLLPAMTALSFNVPEGAQLARLDIPPDRRRQLLLIFKEAITNIARHAAATRVDVSMTLEPNAMVLSIRDDGVGFDAERQSEGYGLENLASRSRSIGAAITIDSNAGAGTTITVVVPLRRRPRMLGWLRPRTRGE